MSGLLRRIKRPGAAEETRTEPTALPDPAHGSAPDGPATGADGQRLPAGLSEEDFERRAATGRRGKLRRRARFLRRARELALRDLGGLVYEARRRERDPGKLAEEKVQRLAALDAELSELDAALGAQRGATVLREPGVGGTCPRCGELHPSDARFCARCGVNLAEAAEEDAAAKAAEAEAERQAAAKAAAEEENHRATEQPAAAEAERKPDGEAAKSGNGRAKTKGGGDAPTANEAPAEAPTEPLSTTPDSRA
jgi:hypothetical protein